MPFTPAASSQPVHPSHATSSDWTPTATPAPVDWEYSDVVAFGPWELHREARSLHAPDGKVVGLSNAEFRLLWVFLQHPRRMLSRERLMLQARGREIQAYERSIDLLLSRLRKKLRHPSAPGSLIKTIHGAGYLFHIDSVSGRND
jgi:two-component system OmpR family response regulator